MRCILGLILVMVVLPPSAALAADDGSDPYSDLQWALHNTTTPGADMDVPGAWSSSRGAGVTVAVVDTGVDVAHPDLAGQIDPDSSNFITGQPATAIADLDGHGTKVAGVIAAGDNGVGTIGVAPDARVLALRALGAEGVGDATAIAAAFDYAGDRGIPIVNASFNGPGRSPAIEQAIASHPGTLFVVAAGNDYGVDDDAVPTYPCDLPAANVLCVGASTSADTPAVFSNVGARSVDLFAPGASVLAPVLDEHANPGWAFTSGTSIAAANEAGVAALVLGAVHTLTTAQLKAALLESGDPIAALHGLSATGRRANAAKAVALALAGPIPADADGDGVADPPPAAVAVPPTPAPASAPVAGTPDPPDVVAPVAAAAAPVVPAVVSFRVQVPRHGRRAIATVRADRRATLALRIERRRCSGKRCAWRTVAAHTVAGATHASLSKRLVRGRYRAMLGLRSNAGAAKPRQRAFAVR